MTSKAEVLRKLHSAIDSIPEPGGGSVPYIVATEPARLTMRALKSTLHSAVNLGLLNYDTSDPNVGGRMVEDVLNTMPAGHAPEGSVGIFGARLPKLAEDLVPAVSSRGVLYHEIADDMAKVINLPKLNTELPLGDVLSHDALYELYPELKNIEVHSSDLIPKGTSGYASGPSINNPFRKPEIVLNGNAPEEEMLNTLLHETQHHVQAIDQMQGYNRSIGSSVETEKNDPFLQRLGNVLSQNPQLLRFMTPEDLQTIQKIPDMINSARTVFNQDLPTLQYMKNPGEFEAYRMEDRIDMTPQERQQAPADLKTGVLDPDEINGIVNRALQAHQASIIQQVGNYLGKTFGRRPNSTLSEKYQPISNEPIPGVRGNDLFDEAAPEVKEGLQKFDASPKTPDQGAWNLSDDALLNLSQMQRGALPDPGNGTLPNDAFENLTFDQTLDKLEPIINGTLGHE